MSTEILSGVGVYPSGTVIIKEGPASPKAMSIILQGSIAVLRNYGMNTERQLKVLTQGNVHGELNLFTGQPPRDTLVALTDATVLTVTRKNISEFFSKQTALAISVVEGLCKKLLENSAEEQSDTEGDLSQKSTLFPEGHGSYTLGLMNRSDLVFPTSSICPLCAHTFDTLTVFESRLRRDKTDPDQRVHYQGIEPMYYEIVTCPNCLFSAGAAKFEFADKSAVGKIMQSVGPYKLEMFIHTGIERDTFTVFAGFYLALLCAPHIYDDHQLITASLWLKISRLYQDAGDENMFLYATKKALEDYLYSYEHLRINEKQSQQVSYMIGEMYFRIHDYDKARQYLFTAKTNKEGTPLLQRQADIRIDEIREVMNAEKVAAPK